MDDGGFRLCERSVRRGPSSSYNCTTSILLLLRTPVILHEYPTVFPLGKLPAMDDGGFRLCERSVRHGQWSGILTVLSYYCYYSMTVLLYYCTPIIL